MTATTPLGMGREQEPWLGLESYQEGDHQRFFGREKETEELLRMVRREVLTVVFGPSGIGKTSLLRAGLFARLGQEGFLPVYTRPVYAADGLEATQQMRACLREAIGRSGIEEDSTTRLAAPGVEAAAAETLWEYLHTIELWDKRNQPVTPVLFLDQFEEVFTLGQELLTAKQFLADLADLVENYMPLPVRYRLEVSGAKIPAQYSRQPYKIVITLREDFVHRLDGLRKPMPSIMHNRYALAQMNGLQALDAVEKPAAGLVDPVVAEKIVRFVAGANIRGQDKEKDGTGAELELIEVEPALLSVICRELNARRIQQKAATITAEQLELSRTDILNDFYERSFEGLPAAARVFVEDRLLTGSGFRSTAPLEDATAAGLDGATISVLIDRRLVRVEQRLDIPHVELTHDLLTKVVQASRDQRHVRERRVRQEQERNARARMRELRQARRSVTYLSLGSVVAIGLAILAVWGWDQARRERSLTQEEARIAGLVSTANETLADDPGLSLALSAFAADAARSRAPGLLYSAENALHAALLAPRVVASLEHPGGVEGLSVAADGTILATAGPDRKVLVWDVASKRKLRTLDGSAVALSPDGHVLAVGMNGFNEDIQLWDWANGRMLRILHAERKDINPNSHTPEGRRTPRVSFSRDGTKIVSSGVDQTAKIWDVQPGSLVRTLKGHTRLVESAVFSPDGSQVATAGDDGTAKLWKTQTGRLERTFSGHTAAVEAIAFSPDGRSMASASDDQSALIWDASDGKIKATLRGHEDTVRGIAFSPDGGTVATVSDDNSARLWDAGSGKSLGSWRGQRGIDTIVFLNRTRLATGGLDGTAKIVEANFGPGTERAKLAGAIGALYAVRFSPDGQLAAASGDDGMVLWQWQTKGKADQWQGHKDAVLNLAFSPDGQQLATGSNDGTAKIWDTRTRKEVRTLTGHEDAVNFVEFSRDGRMLGSASDDGTARVWWMAGTAAPRIFTHTASVESLAFDPGGKGLMTAAGSLLTEWSLETGSKLATFSTEPGGVVAMALSGDGKSLAAVADDYAFRLWHLPAQTPALVLAHYDEAIGLAFSPDGKTFASSGSNGTIQIRDAVNGQVLLTLRGHTKRVVDVAFSPDGRYLASASLDGAVQVYALDVDTLLGLARTRITRTLTALECKQYLGTDSCPAAP